MKKKSIFDNKILYSILILVLIGGSLIGMIAIRSFIGYFMVQAEAGMITHLEIIMQNDTDVWGGYYGMALLVIGYSGNQSEDVIPGDISGEHLLFGCMGQEDEVYATPIDYNDINWSTVTAANVSHIDSFLGYGGSEFDSAANTFTYTVNITLGTDTISAPGTYTYQYGSPNSTTYTLAALEDSAGNIIFATKITGTDVFGFNQEMTNYQLMVPIPLVNTSYTYYFTNDPFEVCPSGYGMGFYGDGYVTGYVVDNATGVPLENVTVSVGGSSNYTDANGFYNFTVQNGLYNLVGLKNTYEPYIGTVNISIQNTTKHNFSMRLAEVALRNGTLYGYVLDNNTGLPIENATVSINGISVLTNASGFYNITALEGTHNLIAIKTGYDNYISSVTNNAGQSTMYNFTMNPLYGTIDGYVKDNSTLLPIENATVMIEGLYTYTNASGYYSVSVPSGTHIIVGTKTGYGYYVDAIIVVGGVTTQHNITLSLLTEGEEEITIVENGTITGMVTDNSTNLPVSGVVVSAGGQNTVSNSTGQYSFDAPPGTYYIVAIKTGYDVYVGNVTVASNTTTYHNISLTAPAVYEEVSNGTVQGYVTENATGTPLSGVTVSSAGQSTLSSSTGFYIFNITPGTHIIAGIKSGYQNHVGTIVITSGNLTEHNIAMSELKTGTGVGAGTGVGSGVGPGKGKGKTSVTPVLERPSKLVDYEISLKKLVKRLRAGTFAIVPFMITNHKSESISVEFSITGTAHELITLDKEKLAIDGESTGEISLTIMGNVEPGIYNGTFVISGDIEEKIPIEIIVYSKEKLPIETLLINVEPLNRKAYIGSNFRYKVVLQNLLDEEKYKVALAYYLKGLTNNISIFLEDEEVVIFTSFSILKNVIIPRDVEPGDYLIVVQAEYLGLTSEHTAIFTISKPIYMYALFGIIPVWILFIAIAVLSTSTFVVMLVKKRASKKKRYAIKVDYGELPKAGPRSAFVGNVAESTNKTYYDLDKFQVHTLVAGASGSGKTIAAQVLVEEALLKNVAVIVFDPSATWTGFLRKCDDKKMLGSYPKYGMKKRDARSFNGNVKQVVNAREQFDFNKYMKPGEINIFVTNKLDTKGSEVFVANTIREVFKANLPESRELKFLMVYDGIHSLLPKFGGSGKVFIQVERATREFRKWGIGLILVSQVLSDFAGEIKANINTEVQMRTRDENDLNRLKEEYGDEILKSIVKASIGTGMTENSGYNKGKPYFVSFRPTMHSINRLSDEELANYNKYNEIIDDLEYQLEQLEKEGVDIFDLKLELKLAKDKVKSGNFNMVNIYLEGLKPRIETQWKKLGKEPKKREVKLVSEEELLKEMQEAKKEKKKLDEKGKEIEKEKEEIKKKEGPKKEVKEEKKEAVKEAPKETEKKEEKVVEKEKKVEEKPTEKEEKKNAEDNNPNENQKNEKSDYIKNLIDETQDLIKENKIDAAKTHYAEIQELYKELPEDKRKEMFDKCAELQNKLIK